MGSEIQGRAGPSLPLASLVAGDRLSPVAEVAWLECQGEAERQARHFPVHLHRCKAEGQALTFAELYWADVIRAKRGLLGMATAFFRLAFNLRHLAQAAASSCHGMGARLGALAGLVARLLYGPAAALNLVLLGCFLVWIVARFTAAAEERPSLDAAYTAAILPVEMWPLMIPTFWFLLMEQAPASLIHPEFRRVFKVAVPTLGVVWLMAAIIAVSFAASYAVRLFVWASWRFPAKYTGRSGWAHRVLA